VVWVVVGDVAVAVGLWVVDVGLAGADVVVADPEPPQALIAIAAITAGTAMLIL
jgi:hypothetical protein